MAYSVHEMFFTLQGEGARTGRVSVFCRFAGCNLWTGREADRAGAACTFCDTVFIGPPGEHGGAYRDAPVLAEKLSRLWSAGTGSAGGAKPYVVFTGGEPLLQLDQPLVDACRAHGFDVAVETNGVTAARCAVDWLCVSPKQLPLTLTRGDELKLVYPQPDGGVTPAEVEALPFAHHFLQPLWTPDAGATARHTRAAIDYCRTHPRWRLSLQTHKLLGLP